MKTVLIVVGILAVIVLAVVGGAAYYFTYGHGMQKLMSQSKPMSDSFDKGFRKSCKDTAVSRGAPEEATAKLCECVLVKYKAGTEIKAAAQQCRAEAAQ